MTAQPVTTHGSARDVRADLLPATAGTAALAMAAYQLLTPGSPEATFGSLSDWVRDLLFLVYLLATVAAVATARRSRDAPTVAAVLVGVGYGLITVGVVAGLALQEDPSWFFVLGGPGLLLSAAGFVCWAVIARRRGRLPAWAALWCAVGGVFAIFGAEIGLSAVIGTFWLWYAVRGRS